MDIRVQELLEKIKRDGVEDAKSQAAKIMAETEKQRIELISAAEKEAKAIVEKARSDALRAEESGKAALLQSSRDLVRAFKDEIEKVLAAIVKSETESAFTAETLKKAVPAVLEAWAKTGSDDVSLMLPAVELNALDAFFREALAARLKKGLEINPLKNAKAGFRIMEKNGSAYYDFSAEAVAGMLSAYLNTKLAAIMAEAVR